MQSKSFEAKIEHTDEPRTLEAMISTVSVDRDGDVLMPSGLQASEFNRNPVVLFGHDASRLPIGKSLGLQTTPRGVMAKVQFAERPASLPLTAEWPADTIFDLFKQGVLSAFSVGFTITKARAAEKKDIRRFGRGVRRVISEWKLLEFSVVTIPANQDALVTAIGKGLVEPDTFVHDELLEHIHALDDIVIDRGVMELRQPPTMSLDN